MVFEEQKIDDVLVLRLCHGKVNAMDLEFCDQLINRFNELESNPDCKGIIVTGNDRVFSAGIDLKRWLEESTDYVEPFIRRLEELFATVFCFPKPLVSLINGPAIAGGCMLATACDIRVIQSAAKIGILEARLGVPLPITAVEIVRHVAIPTAFRKIISVGATFVGNEAVEVGLADISWEADLLDVALDHVQQLIAIPPATYSLTKQQLRDPVLRMIEQNRQTLFETYLTIWKSPEIRDAISEYVQQRLR